jgi:EAL domain-containing protein (putative c-di-GMP-specific phosphodiesterase class I)
VIEITETALSDATLTAQPRVIKALGVGVAIDDFGRLLGSRPLAAVRSTS